MYLGQETKKHNPEMKLLSVRHLRFYLYRRKQQITDEHPTNQDKEEFHSICQSCCLINDTAPPLLPAFRCSVYFQADFQGVALDTLKASFCYPMMGCYRKIMMLWCQEVDLQVVLIIFLKGFIPLMPQQLANDYNYYKLSVYSYI